MTSLLGARRGLLRPPRPTSVSILAGQVPFAAFWDGNSVAACLHAPPIATAGLGPTVRPGRPNGGRGARYFSSPALPPANGLDNLRRVFERARGKRIPLAQAEDAVWDAYAALGSTKGLTGEDVRDVAHFITAHAIAEQAKLRAGPEGRTEAQRRTAKLVDKANVRTRRLLLDAAQKGGIAIDEKAVTWFIQVNDRLLVSYAACKELMDFLRLECGLTLTARHLNTLVRNVAHRGNYTAFLKLLHEILTANFIPVMDGYIVNLFLKAVAEASPAASEDLEGYARRQTIVADLAVPMWALDKGDPAVRSRSVQRDALDPLEVEPDPGAALRDAILSGPDVRIMDLCAPGMPQGSVTPVRKVLQLLAFAAARHREGQRDIVDAYTCTVAAGAANAWNHRRLARAVLEVLSGEPFRVSPNATLFSILLAEASDGRDSQAGERLLAQMRRLHVEPDKKLFTAMIHFYARTGRLALARDTLKEMLAAGHKPDGVTGMALLEGILTAETTVGDVKRAMELLSEGGIPVTIIHWSKALHYFAARRDLQSMERIWNDMPVAPNEIAVATCANAYEKFGSADQLLAFLGGTPRQLLSTSETWSAAIRAFARRGTVSRDEEFAHLAFVLCCAVLDRVPIDAAALPPGKRDLPLAGIPPPLPLPGLLLVIFDGMRTRLGGDRLRILEDKGRAYLAGEGYSGTEGMGAEEMYRMLGRSGGVRLRSRNVNRAGGVVRGGSEK
ncbi:hypothetical protein DFJ74DRAFT_671669 [Hyaloraphidium curvatum]|nr:hypothetical protein DFJ74DRAFT_671669 [Hyaloraphidium curvatum]